MSLSEEPRASLRSALQVAKMRAPTHGPTHRIWDVILDTESILAGRSPMTDWDIDRLIDELNRQ